MVANRTDHERVDPSEQIPEADLLEQQAPLDPTLTHNHDGNDGRAERGEDTAAAWFVDEADRWEQQLTMPSADDEYPHDDPGDRFEAE